MGEFDFRQIVPSALDDRCSLFIEVKFRSERLEDLKKHIRLCHTDVSFLHENTFYRYNFDTSSIEMKKGEDKRQFGFAFRINNIRKERKFCIGGATHIQLVIESAISWFPCPIRYTEIDVKPKFQNQT